MAEPASTPAAIGVVAFAVAVTGPFIGPYLVIILGALLGAMWAVWNDPDITRRVALWYVPLAVLAAVLLDAAVAAWVSTSWGLSIDAVLPGVAIAIGAFGYKLLPVLQRKAARWIDAPSAPKDGPP